MDTIVTARVPVEIKEQGNEVLKRIGATQTQLINAAYEYVLTHEALPEAKEAVAKKRRRLTQEQKKKLSRSLEKSSFAVPEEYWQGKTYQDLIAQGKKADYEALA